MAQLMNFVYGAIAIAKSTSLTLKHLIDYQLLWGAGFGFLVATLIYALVLAESPRKLCIILTHDKKTSLQRLTPVGETCLDPKVTRHFIRTIDRARFFLSLGAFIFFISILISLVWY